MKVDNTVVMEVLVIEGLKIEGFMILFCLLGFYLG